jgi:hypothetical protein
MATICEACGRPIPQPRLPGSRRFGVLLTTIKCDVVDIVAAAGAAGITTPELVRALYRDRPPASRTIKVHVWWINMALRETGWRIVNERRRWFLRQGEGTQ